MKLPLLLQLRSELKARRYRSELTTLLIAFIGPLLFGACYFAYKEAQWYAAYHLPKFPLLVAITIIWVVVGIPGQMRLLRDSKWNSFVRQMPVSPFQLLALHASASLPLTAIFGLMAYCMVLGISQETSIVTASLRCLVTLVATVWVLSMQVFVAMIVSRLRRGLMGLAMVLSLLALASVLHIIWKHLANNHVADISNITSSDPILILSGLAPLIRALLEPSITAVRSAFVALAHLVLLTAAFAAISWRLAIRPIVPRRQYLVAILLTGPIRRLMARLVPGPLGGELCIEWLRTFRGTSPCIALYAVASVIASILLVAYSRTANEAMAVLVIAATGMACDGVPEILQIRSANRLYNTFGVDTSHYLWGFITAVAATVTAFCIAQVPMFCVNRPDLPFTLFVCSVCVATAFTVVPVSVHISRVVGQLPRNLVGRLLAMAKVNFVVLLIPLFLLLLGGFLAVLPLLFAGVFVSAEIRRTRRSTVEKLYWRLQDDTA